MSQVYFIFKPLRIHNIGGQFPDGVKAIAEKGGWYSSTIDSDDAFTDYFKLDEYQVMPVSSGVAYGWGYIGATVSGTELEANQAAATNMFKKIQIRAQVGNDVGDHYDLISDLEKRIVRSERLLFALAGELFTSTVEISKTKLAWSKRVNDYLAALTDGTLTNVYDLYTAADIDTKLLDRGTEIKTIVEDKTEVEVK
jgi:hypothetical protein